jgi:hypothetical protein
MQAAAYKRAQNLTWLPSRYSTKLRVMYQIIKLTQNLWLPLFLMLLSCNSYSGCDANISVGSDGTVYSQGNNNFRHGLTETNRSIKQTTQVYGSGIRTSQQRQTVAGIRQSSSGQKDNHLNFNILPEDSYYQPCDQLPKKQNR